MVSYIPNTSFVFISLGVFKYLSYKKLLLQMHFMLYRPHPFMVILLHMCLY
jgi:hypothetical protein